MTPQQIQQSSTVELITVFKNKARCFHSQRKANSVFDELNRRLGSDAIRYIHTAWSHVIDCGESDAELNDECDKLIEKFRCTND